jgi:hypothetical protein
MQLLRFRRCGRPRPHHAVYELGLRLEPGKERRAARPESQPGRLFRPDSALMKSGGIAQDSPCNADKLIDEIEATCLKLVRFKSMGRNRDEIHPDLQSFLVGKYLWVSLNRRPAGTGPLSGNMGWTSLGTW